MLIFVDHCNAEVGNKSLSDQTKSKVNMAEIMMVSQLVRYLLLQNYRPDQIVILTPYLGQLLELQKSLAKQWTVLIDELDMDDLKKLAADQLTLEPLSKADLKKSIRVATVDNYQGIVILKVICTY